MGQEFRRKGCGYSSWWITIKAKFFFFRLSHSVVTCDVDRDVSTAYCKSSSDDEVDLHLDLIKHDAHSRARAQVLAKLRPFSPCAWLWHTSADLKYSDQKSCAYYAKLEPVWNDLVLIWSTRYHYRCSITVLAFLETPGNVGTWWPCMFWTVISSSK